MNILPLVSFFLLLLAMGSTALFKERIETFWEETYYKGHQNAEMRLRNSIESKSYKKAPDIQAAAKSPHKPSKPGPNANYPNKRRKICLPSKLNIGHLFSQQNEASSQLYEISAKLLHELYSHTSFFKDENLPFILLDAMIEKGKMNNEDTLLSDLFPDDPKLQKIFYKMLKGTKNYDLEKKIGYPSLDDFIFIDTDEKVKPIHFCFAAPPLLISIFGKEIASSIQIEEKKKWQNEGRYAPLNKEELQQVIFKDHKNAFNLNKIEELLSFTKKTVRSHIVTADDAKTGIIIKRRY